MILRSIGVRHGRRAVSRPLARASLRCFTTENGSKPAATLAETSEPLDPVTKYEVRKHFKKNIRSVGSSVERRYKEDDLLKQPLSPSAISLERLMAAQTHMGHHASLWNPANSRYIYGVREGIHIISLETTAAHLRRAATVVEEVSYRGGLVLFAGTRRGQMDIVTEAAREAKACHLFTKWTPGAITNRDIILRDRFINIVNEKDEILPGFDRYIPETRPLVPDLVVCLNPLENYTMLYECGLAGIPTIGVIDTDADPSWVTYTIPANDDSLRSVALIGSVLGQAGKQGQRRRLAEAEEGHVPWQTPRDITQFIDAMKSQRGEILSSLVDKKIISGLKEPSEDTNVAAPPRLVPEEQDDAEEEDLPEDLAEEGDELLKELSSKNFEMDAVSEMEKEILATLSEAAKNGALAEAAIMAEVGVKKGIPEEGQAEAKPAAKGKKVPKPEQAKEKVTPAEEQSPKKPGKDE